MQRSLTDCHDQTGEVQEMNPDRLRTPTTHGVHHTFCYALVAASVHGSQRLHAEPDVKNLMRVPRMHMALT